MQILLIVICSECEAGYILNKNNVCNPVWGGGNLFSYQWNNARLKIIRTVVRIVYLYQFLISKQFIFQILGIYEGIYNLYANLIVEIKSFLNNMRIVVKGIYNLMMVSINANFNRYMIATFEIEDNEFYILWVDINFLMILVSLIVGINFNRRWRLWWW